MTSATTTLIGTQIERASTDFADIGAFPLPDGSTIVTVDLDLGSGWSRPRVTARFVLPVPYPSAQPDCFYTDADLRLATGAMPMNTGLQPLNGEQLLWFSWHVASWQPARDNVTTYIRFIEGRLRDAR